MRESDFAVDLLARLAEVKLWIRQAPLVLGGSSGSTGGSGGPVGGFIGLLPQQRVAGDLTESFNYAQSSGSPRHLLDNLDRLRAYSKASHNFFLTTGSPPTNRVTIASGSWHHTSGQEPLYFQGGLSPTIGPPTTGSRFDILSITTTGILHWTHGAEGNPPIMPSFPSATSGSMPLWVVLARSSGSVIQYFNDNISHYVFRDERPFLDWGVGGAGGSGSAPQPAGFVLFTDPNGAPIVDSEFSYDRTANQMQITSTTPLAIPIYGLVTGAGKGGIGVIGEANVHEGVGVYGSSSNTSSGSGLYAVGGYGGAAKLFSTGNITFEHTSPIVEVIREVNVPASVNANVTGALLHLKDNVTRSGGGTTSGSHIRGEVSGAFKFAVERSGHFITSGSINIQGFQMSPGGTIGYVLTSNAQGVGSWAPSSTGSSLQPGGRVIFTDSNGALITDSNLLWDNTNKQLQLTATGSSAGIQIGGDVNLYRSAANELTLSDGFLITNSNMSMNWDGGSGFLRLTAADANIESSFFIGRHSRGTLASPSAIITNDDLFGFIGHGHDGSAWVPGGGMFMVAEENWGTNAHGARMEFYTLPIGGNFYQENMRLTGAGQLRLPVTGSSAGLLLGGDFQIYRSAADVGRTPDSFVVDGRVGIGTASLTHYVNIVGDGTTTGVTLFVNRNLSSASTDSAVVFLRQQHAGDDQDTLYLDQAGTGYALTVNTGSMRIVGGHLYLSANTYLVRTLAALPNGAGANTATLTNAPVTGNPTKWVALDDNGITRYIPMW